MLSSLPSVAESAGAGSSQHASSEMFIAGSTNAPAQFNPVTQAAALGGVRTCLDRLEQVSNFVTTGAQSGGFLFLPNEGPANELLSSASFEVGAPGSNTAYASVTTAPRQGGCGALYETVNYWEVSCAEVQENVYPSLPLSGVLREKVWILDGGSNMRVFVMPVGENGCVSIKKEVLY